MAPAHQYAAERVRIDPKSELVPWLQQLRAQQVALRDYEHTPLVRSGLDDVDEAPAFRASWYSRPDARCANAAPWASHGAGAAS